MASTLWIGLLAGIFGGLVGLGGGVVMIPLMVGRLGFTQHQAHATSLVAVVFTGLSGAGSYALEGAVDARAALALALPAMALAHAGARSAHALPEWKLKRVFGTFVLVVAALLILRPYVLPAHEGPGGALAYALLAAIGGATGFVSGMMGIGGGSLMVPAMVLLLGTGQHLAQGTSLLSMVPSGAVGAWTHWRLGAVQARVVPGLVAGVVAGTFAGGQVANLIPEAGLRVFFAAVLVWTGLRYVRARRPAPKAAAPGNGNGR